MRKSCRCRKTLKNAPSLANGGANFANLADLFSFFRGEDETMLLEFAKIRWYFANFFSKCLSNFSKIGTSDSERGRIFQRFSRSTRFSHFFQKIMKILLKILLFSQKSPEFSEIFSKITKFNIHYWKTDFHNEKLTCISHLQNHHGIPGSWALQDS